MARQKNKTKTGSSKHRLQYADSQLCDAIDAVKKGMVLYAASRTFGIPYKMLCNKISGRTSIKVQCCRYELVLGEHIENKLVECAFSIRMRGILQLSPKTHLLIGKRGKNAYEESA